IADRPRAQPRPERVADHAANAGVRPAIRFNRRGPVMRLDLEADVELLVERHHAGVVLEDAHAPVVGAESFADLLRGGEDRLLQHVAEGLLSPVVAIANPPGERLMAAVFAPGL